MQKLIDTSTAFYGAGNSPGARCFKLTLGPYTGRRILIFGQSPTTVVMSFADPPYSQWSTPALICEDAADYPVSGVMDAVGNVQIVYTKAATLALVTRKLTFSSGGWQIGAEVTVYGDKDNYFAAIATDASGRLHVCWTCFNQSDSKYYLHHKKSTDGGASWGGGAADPGTVLTSGSSGCYGCLTLQGEFLYCFYTDDGTRLAYRRLADGATLWSEEVVLHNGTGLDDRLAAVVSESGSLMGVAYVADDKLQFLEFDTENWSSPFAIADSPTTPPLLFFNGSLPVVCYGVAVGSGQIRVQYRYKSGSGFMTAADVHPELGPFDYVLLFDADGSPQWQNLSAAAADDTAGDVYHPISGKLIQAVGDCIYLGSEEKFAAATVLLSTAGDSGGTVSWRYYDGSQWVEFTPVSGAFNFDQTGQLVRLWTDTSSAPGNWQKTSVDGKTAYWVRVEVTTGFTTAPVGSQLTPLVDLVYLNR